MKKSVDKTLEKLLHDRPQFQVKPTKQNSEDRAKAKLMQVILERHFDDDKNVVDFNMKRRQMIKQWLEHYMTCTNPVHQHDISVCDWRKENG